MYTPPHTHHTHTPTCSCSWAGDVWRNGTSILNLFWVPEVTVVTSEHPCSLWRLKGKAAVFQERVSSPRNIFLRFSESFVCLTTILNQHTLVMGRRPLEKRRLDPSRQHKLPQMHVQLKMFSSWKLKNKREAFVQESFCGEFLCLAKILARYQTLQLWDLLKFYLY